MAAFPPEVCDAPGDHSDGRRGFLFFHPGSTWWDREGPGGRP